MESRKKVLREVEEYAQQMYKRTNSKQYDPGLLIYLKEAENVCDILKKNVLPNQYKEYASAFDLFIVVTKFCETESFLKENWETVCDTTQAIYKCIKSLTSSKKCPVCQNKVSYRRLPFYYDDMQKKYGHIPHEAELINVEEYMCPTCSASDRDRMIVGFLKKLELMYAQQEKKLLHFAPAKSIDYWINGECFDLTYHTLDLYMAGTTFRADITDMNGIQDNTYDYWICSHVLEHVQDDRKALRELVRILKPEGLGILLVPIALDIEKTDEEWGLTPEENWKRFGQDDHCRQYAKSDFLNRITEEGIKVYEVGKEYFGEEFFEEAALKETSTLYILSKSEKNLEELITFNRPEKRKIEKPLVSVIMSSYNHEEYVAKTVESVLNQTYDNIEFLVADDGSSDRTVEILKSYEQHFSYVRYFEENYGERLNELLPYVKGKYIAHIHSDDMWKEDKIEKQIRFMEGHPSCDVCTTWAEYIDINGNGLLEGRIFLTYNRSPKRWIHDLLYDGNRICFPSSVWKSGKYIELASQTGNWAYYRLGDLYFWLRLLEKGIFYIIPEVLVIMNRHNTNISKVSEEATIQAETSFAHIRYRMIADMKRDLFIKVFFDEMINKNASRPEEIACEKFFVLKSFPGEYMHLASIFYYSDLCRKPENFRCMKEEYKFSDRDFFEFQLQNKNKS